MYSIWHVTSNLFVCFFVCLFVCFYSFVYFYLLFIQLVIYLCVFYSLFACLLVLREVGEKRTWAQSKKVVASLFPRFENFYFCSFFCLFQIHLECDLTSPLCKTLSTEKYLQVLNQLTFTWCHVIVRSSSVRLEGLLSSTLTERVARAVKTNHYWNHLLLI